MSTTSPIVPVALAVGTHTWTVTPKSEVAQDKIVEIMRKHDIHILDTARGYGQGASETTIGNKGFASEFIVSTKAATGVFEGTGKRDKILEFAKQSFDALKISKVPLYFLHAPDETVPVEEQMGAIQTLYKEGRFDAFGISNFSKEQVIEFHSYAKSQGFILPTVYQSSYSPAVRGNETRLFPTLRALGISIQAYSPMAAGFLAKTPDYIEEGKGSWDPNTPTGMVYRHLYYKPSFMKMLAEYGKLSEDSGVNRSGLAYRWVRHHSALNGNLGDQMIIGATSPEQFEEAILEIEKGPLEPWVVAKMDELWEMVKEDAPVDNLEAVRTIYRQFA